jgi:hypothetical protein
MILINGHPVTLAAALDLIRVHYGAAAVDLVLSSERP